MRRWIWIVFLVTATAVGGAVSGQHLPKLPQELTLKQSPDSPGKVTFLHATHLGDRPDCTRCHPRLFSIMKQGGAAAERRITHARMEKGGQCGACHNGKAAFGFDDCTACHKQ